MKIATNFDLDRTEGQIEAWKICCEADARIDNGLIRETAAFLSLPAKWQLFWSMSDDVA